MTLSITEFLKLSGNEFASIAEDGITAGDISGFVDTGSYTLNAVISGSLFKGLPMNKISALAGETGVGKCARGSQLITVYFESEKDLEEFLLE